jgi:hypothetical protein
MRITIALAAAATLLHAAPASAQFTALDWVMHRADNRRTGGNSDPGLVGLQYDQAWIYPSPADLPAEIVVDNTTLPPPPANATGQRFEVVGAWAYPALSDRAAGLWPYSDVDPNKVGDYVVKDAVKSDMLAAIGTSILSQLPNLNTDLSFPDPTNPGGTVSSSTLYKYIHDETLKATTNYARWTFGTGYPTGTFQEQLDVSGRPLQPNQRYAVYMRFPSSSTLFGGVPRPMTDNVLVRVSWGANPDDPITSRLFLVNSGQTGDFWLRIRSGSSDDRYFPYDGTNPIRVTLYDITPDEEINSSGVRTTIVADSVRLVPEALRGDIHAPAASARYTQPGNNFRLTWFGRDETSGPPNLFPTLANATSTQAQGFARWPFNPTLPLQTNSGQPNYNPYISDPSSSVRSAVFYCIEDNETQAKYGMLRWRYVARTNPRSGATIENPGVAPAGWNLVTGGQATIDQAYGADYLTSNVQSGTPPPAAPFVRWSTSVGDTGANVNITYSVYVWIPGGNPLGAQFAKFATYRIYTNSGTLDVRLDQQNTDHSNASVARLGTWRLLSSGVRFPQGGIGSNVQIDLYNYSSDPGDAGRVVAADAVMIVPESQQRNSVQAAPLVVKNVQWPSGALRDVVYFATTSGHVWALDALGVGVVGNTRRTATTCYWTYPSLNNPERVTAANPFGAITFPYEDPNNRPDPGWAPANGGIDADLSGPITNTPANDQILTAINKTPDVGGFVASPMYVEVEKPGMPVVREKYIIVASTNGRIYALDPVGRTNSGGDPYGVTIAVGDNPGVPGTTRRLMTWPTTARDKFLARGGVGAAGNFSQYTDDPSKTSFNATPTAPILDTNFRTDRVIAGAADGHVYAVDLQRLDKRVRISNWRGTASDTNNGRPLWRYPDTDNQLPAITQPGTLTAANTFVFTAGGRVYSVSNPNTSEDGVAALQWIYPFTASPPGAPAPSDVAALQTPFTAPLSRSSVGTLNGGNEVVFIANTDGSVYAFDNTVVGGAAANILWRTDGYGPTRASVTYLERLEPSQGIGSAPAGRSLLLPLDTGEIVGMQAEFGGQLLWSILDGLIGGVPTTDQNGFSTPTPTSNTFRGADAIPANGWIYQGDEGNQNTGEMYGLMRAYTDTGTPGRPQLPPNINRAGSRNSGTVDMRFVELFDSKKDLPAGNFEDIGQTLSAYDEWKNNRYKANTQGNFTIYEWGDTIYVVAWGTYTGNVLPRVQFTLIGANNVRQPITVGAVNDPNPPPGIPMSRRAWIAKYQFALTRGSANDPQTPGTTYRVDVVALMIGPGNAGRSLTMRPGTAIVDKTNPNPVTPPVRDENTLLGAVRAMAMAHPIALTTRSDPGGTPIGPAARNIVGWTNNVPANNAAVDISEMLANGNMRVQLTGGNITPVNIKDLAAPLGMLPHGSTALYQGIALDGSGNILKMPALFIADRSNMYKQNQALNNVRVERRDLRWTYDPQLTDPDPARQALRRATGDVLNPLPYDDFTLDPPYRFPKNLPNVSLDYPDIPRTAAVLRGNGIDMSVRSITLPTALNNAGTRTLRPQPLDLTVDIPKYQPANINLAYQDANGFVKRPSNGGAGLYGPMYIPNGEDVSNGIVPPAARRLISPSAGYTATLLVFLDANNDGRYEGTGVQTQNRQNVTTTREEVFRSFNVGVAVAPDLNLRTEELTVDIGKAPHSMGFAPNVPFAPSGIGPYRNGTGPFDDPALPALFLPFTVQNHGNVNLFNLRVAKTFGDNSTAGSPLFWTRMASDQVDGSSVVGQILSRYITAPVMPGVGNLGIVTSLDHARGAANLYDLERDYGGVNNFWPYNLGLAHPTFAGSGNPYVFSGNILNWPAGVNPQPTLHKARPGDPSPTVLSIPDVAYGDPLGVLSTLRTSAGGIPGRDVRPKIGVAVPLGTPAGTYSAPIYVFEDATPMQWRMWQAAYAGITGQALSPAYLNPNNDNDGILNRDYQVVGGVTLPVGAPVETTVANPFNLKVTVTEARLTNNVVSPAVGGLQADRSFPAIDIRTGPTPPMGVDLQPTAIADRTIRGGIQAAPILLTWASNRLNNGVPAAPVPDGVWSLFNSQLNGRVNPASGLSDFVFETVSGMLTRWWNPLPNAAQFPPVAMANNLFPSQQSDVVGSPATPLVPGVIQLGSTGQPQVRHASPALTQDDGNIANPQIWLFWQGAATKSTAGGNSASLDARTFYVPMTYNAGTGQWTPDASANSGVPYGFLNDPALPKFGPKPVLLRDINNTQIAFLFWYGGPQGRTRLYYNSNVGNLSNPAAWSRDSALQTPGALSTQSDPVPVHRRVFTTWFRPSGETLDVIDLVYTGTLTNRKQPETILTRYALEYPRNTAVGYDDPSYNAITGSATGRLIPMPIGVTDQGVNGQLAPETAWKPSIVNELMVRDGTSQTWASRDLAWVTRTNRRDPNDTTKITRDNLFLDTDGIEKPHFIIYVNGQPVNGYVPAQNRFTRPRFDQATGKLYFDSTLGGELIVDPQAGTVTFPHVTPKRTDVVTISYTPQSMRLNPTRHDTNIVATSGPWIVDPGNAPRPHVPPVGSNTQPSAFIDRYQNAAPSDSRRDEFIPKLAPGQATPPITRMWVLYRKTGANTVGTASLHYKTMRLMVRLPRTVLRDQLANGTYTTANHVRITGNKGPVEIDWARGRLYFTEIDEGSTVTVEFDYGRQANGTVLTVPASTYRVLWGDEISVAVNPGDQPSAEVLLPTEAQVNEGAVTAFKDPFQDRVWVFFTSTRNGSTDLYYMTLAPQFYPVIGQ